MVEICLLAGIAWASSSSHSYVQAIVFASFWRARSSTSPNAYPYIIALIIFLVRKKLVWLSIVSPLRQNGKLDLVRTFQTPDNKTSIAFGRTLDLSAKLNGGKRHLCGRHLWLQVVKPCPTTTTFSSERTTSRAIGVSSRMNHALRNPSTFRRTNVSRQSMSRRVERGFLGCRPPRHTDPARSAPSTTHTTAFGLDVAMILPSTEPVTVPSSELMDQEIGREHLRGHVADVHDSERRPDDPVLERLVRRSGGAPTGHRLPLQACPPVHGALRGVNRLLDSRIIRH